MTRHPAATLTALLLASCLAVPTAGAREAAVIERIDDASVELRRDRSDPVEVWISDDAAFDTSDRLISERSTERSIRLALPSDQRSYVILRGAGGTSTVAAERLLPLEQASNFRDIGGYITRDGRMVRWGKAFRSGAMPLLTERDYAVIGQLGLDSVVDLRSLDERQINADAVDDRTGALFLSNDYTMRDLMAQFRSNGGENAYKGMEKQLVPQYRALFSRILADEGAVLYHCSAGQDRTGVATALLYDALGVDRETILRDYHLSTEWRRTEWEMPEIDPADYPGNFIVEHYARSRAEGHAKPEPLYTKSGASLLAQFFVYLDAEYGGAEGYLRQGLGMTDDDIARLREIMLY